MKSFLDNFIPDRIRIFKEDKNIEYIYQLLHKHVFGEISEIKKIYQIKAHYIRSELTIKGEPKHIYKLFRYLEVKNVSFLSFTQDTIVVEIDDFLRKIY